MSANAQARGRFSSGARLEWATTGELRRLRFAVGVLLAVLLSGPAAWAATVRTVTLHNGDSYDFSTQTRGYLSGGDFYHTTSSPPNRLWANNSGQRGLQDLGPEALLDLDFIPGSGYTRYGVPAVVGHTYVSLAQAGEEGNYVFFSVTAVGASDVTLDWIYSGDCNSNGVPDYHDIDVGDSADCNANTIPDECDISQGTSLDDNGDGVPDECRTALVAQMGQKGSLLVYPKVEVRWDAAGNLIQDTFIQVSNDYPSNVYVQAYYVNGDEPLPAAPPEREHPGWNWIDFSFYLTSNQPCCWSVYTGEGFEGLPNMPPLSVLDPGLPPGRPDPQHPGQRVLQGYLVLWAVNGDDQQINWNHLTGTALIVDYADATVWDYTPWAAKCETGVANGAVCGVAAGEGERADLALNGAHYDYLPQDLLLQFSAAGATFLDAETDLTLMPFALDLRQEASGPSRISAIFDIWNMNEVKFGGPRWCVTCWGETLLSDFAAPNYFLASMLGTDEGVTRIAGRHALECTGSGAAPFLGVAARRVDYAGAAGTSLVGTGAEPGMISYDQWGGGPERIGMGSPFTAGPSAQGPAEHGDPAEPRSGDPPRTSVGRKGSLVVFPKVELRWDAAGQIRQDTMLELHNDDPGSVELHLEFVQGDPSLASAPPERAHPGWNSRSARLSLTGHEPTCWSVMSGLPKGVPAFTELDPGSPPGRPDPEGSTDRVLRGFVLAWAANDRDEEIHWNHLSGRALLLDVATGATWAYDAYTFEALSQNGAVEQGEATGTPHELNLNGTEFDYCTAYLYGDFFASGSTALSSGDLLVVTDSDLTLLTAVMDLSDAGAPTTTVANFYVWNAYENALSGTRRCITLWDQQKTSLYSVPNAFNIDVLHTDNGRFRLDGAASAEYCPASVAAPLLGIRATLLDFDAGLNHEAAGSALIGAGTEVGQIRYDADCNGNGVADSEDVAGGTSSDCNSNALPDECEHDCNCNNVDDRAELVGYGFARYFPALFFNTPAGTASYVLSSPPRAATTVVVPLNVVNAGPGNILLSINGMAVGGSALSGPPGCFGAGTVVSVDPAVFNLAVNGGDASLQFTITGYYSCGVGVLNASLIYTTEPLPDCDESGVPDECEVSDPGHDCCTVHGPGCSDPVIVDCVCAGDPYCCNTYWDSYCVQEVVSYGCGYCTGDCNTNGMLDECDIAGGTSPDCNWNSWPDECDVALEVVADCDADGQPDECQMPGHNCCATGHGPGCSDEAVSACVCALDSFCCVQDWDWICALEVDSLGCGSCSGDCNSNLVLDVCEGYGDETVGLADLDLLVDCLRGPLQWYQSPCCRLVDFDENMRMDLHDFAALQKLLTP